MIEKTLHITARFITPQKLLSSVLPHIRIFIMKYSKLISISSYNNNIKHVDWRIQSGLIQAWSYARARDEYTCTERPQVKNIQYVPILLVRHSMLLLLLMMIAFYAFLSFSLSLFFFCLISPTFIHSLFAGPLYIIFRRKHSTKND